MTVLGEDSRGSDLSGEPTAEPSPGSSPAPRPEPSGSLSGSVVAQFEVLERIGAGGFGEVYRARDTRLGRSVAVKVLPEALAKDAGRRERFRREAVAASALNHPNICTVHDLVESDGKHLIVMELVEGKTLYAALKEGPLPLEKLLPIALQVTEALGEAHRAGILHRDVKTGNIALTSRGQVKVLDFGLAKLLGGETEEEGQTVDRLTEEGAVFGTLAYMSPEQLLGKPLDCRSDLFSLGVVLYEMATGRLPFAGSSKIAIAEAILHAEPRHFPDWPLPDGLRPIVQKLLQKEPARRYATADELHRDLASLQESIAPRGGPGLSRGARIGIAAAVLVLAIVTGSYLHKASRERWALSQVPEINRLIEAEDFIKASALIEEARTVLPKDPALEKLWLKATGEATVETDPPGADVSVRPFKADENAWRSLGATPVKKVRLPQALYVWRISRAGSAPLTLFSDESLELNQKLLPEANVPSGMVPVLGFKTRLGWPLQAAPWLKVESFLIDRTEVTNEEFRKFVDAGGYRNRALWKVPFVRGGRVLPWEEAMALLTDSTGRPGPSTWEVGSFPKGKERHPVAGVSWYEAMAYAEFAGKILPTAYHWYVASGVGLIARIVPGSNFREGGTQPVGGLGALSGFGTSDMAGNVKEWCRNEGRDGNRLILGGGFGEPTYMFNQSDARSPWERRPTHGFRCVKLLSPLLPETDARLEPEVRDFLREVPVSDEVFSAFRGQYRYDAGELAAKVEETKAAGEWTWERVAFNAAYGSERLAAHVFLPKNAAPPLQAVVYLPGAYALLMNKLEPSDFAEMVDYFLASGRMVVLPVLKGTWDRRNGVKPGGPAGHPPAFWRDEVIMWSKDLGRTLDYLESRKDVDPSRMAYFGFSFGGAIAPVLLGVEQRFKAAVLVDSGFWVRRPLPEVDSINFVTRVRVPALMLNGKFDMTFPTESSVSMFKLLGTPAKDKRQVLYDTGHGGVARKDEIRETLDWLDRYLGPVNRKPQ